MVGVRQRQRLFGWVCAGVIGLGCCQADELRCQEESPPAGDDAASVIRPAIEPASQIRPRRVPEQPRFRWQPALRQSALFLAIQQGFRIGTQPATREKLKGPFFRDYWRSVQGFRNQWHDSDSWLANYAGHPMQGAVTGYIQVHNDPRGIRQEFGFQRDYWKSRLRATVWNTAYSLQYEFGPLGESAIGNVGLRPGTKGWIDLVITPTLGMATMVAEDAADRHIITPLEKRVRFWPLKMALRGCLNPNRSMANLLRLRVPWIRDTRPGIFARP